jgi:hypothetical protein
MIIKNIWKPVKMKAIKEKDIVHEVYGRGRIVGPVPKSTK